MHYRVTTVNMMTAHANVWSARRQAIRGGHQSQMFSSASVLQGVVTHSSGNHGGALALAAKLRGIPAHVVVPHDTPLCKIGAIEGYGGAPLD